MHFVTMATPMRYIDGKGHISELRSSGIATLGPTGALAPPSASVAPPLTYHMHGVHNYILCLYLDINCKYLPVKVHLLVSLAVGL